MYNSINNPELYIKLIVLISNMHDTDASIDILAPALDYTPSAR